MRTIHNPDGSDSLFADNGDLLMTLENPSGFFRPVEDLYALIFTRGLELCFPSVFKSLTRLLTDDLYDVYNALIERR